MNNSDLAKAIIIYFTLTFLSVDIFHIYPLAGFIMMSCSTAMFLGSCQAGNRLPPKEEKK